MGNVSSGIQSGWLVIHGGQESTCGPCESFLDVWGTQCPSGQLVCPMWQRVLTAGQHHHEPLDGHCPLETVLAVTVP